MKKIAFPKGALLLLLALLFIAMAAVPACKKAPEETTTEEQTTVPETTEAITTEPEATTAETTETEETTEAETTTVAVTECVHEYEDVMVEPTCKKDGSITHTCAKCGESYADVIEAPGHTYKTETLKATCTEAGKQVSTCSVCGYVYTKALKATGHSFVNGACKNCGETEATTAPVTTAPETTPPSVTDCAHEYQSSTVDATCTAEGVTTYTCSKCGDSYSETTSALGHRYDSVTADPTCTEAGKTTYTCSVCGHHYSESIPAKGHTYVGGSCSVCGKAEYEMPTDAASLDSFIASIGSGSLTNEKKIDLAYLAYHQLSAGQKAKVKNYKKLLNLMSELTEKYVVKDYVDTRMPHHKFLIGTWLCQNVAPDLCLYDDAHLQEMADADIDYVVQPIVNDVSLAQHYKYGIGMIPWTADLNLPFYFGGWREEGQDPQPVFDEAAFREASKNYIDHPAIWGSFQCDEPNANDFAYYSQAGKIIEEELLPDTANFYCLFPNLASSVKMGRSSYSKYVSAFVSAIDSDTIYTNHYLYNSGKTGNLSTYLRNLDTIATQCYKTGRDLWIVLQVNNDIGRGFVVSIDMMKFQAYTSMAYGAKSVTWGCWIYGWGENNIYDDNGNRTAQYEKMQETNVDLKALEPIYMRYTGKSNCFLVGANGNPGGKCGPSSSAKIFTNHVNSNGVGTLENTMLTNLATGDSDLVLTGHYTKNVGSGEAYLFVNCNDFWFKTENTAVVTFSATNPDSVVTAYVKGVPTVLEAVNGVYTVEIQGADAVFVTVE